MWDRNRRGLTVGLILTVTLVAFEGLAVSTIMPAVRADLGGIALYGWVFSAFMLANLVSTVLAGQAADRRGVGVPFTAGVALFAAGLAIDAAAPTMLVLVGGRVVQGLGAGAVSASAVTTVARGYPPPLRPRMLALMSTAWVVPGLIGPAVSGVVADTIGWRWVFGGLLPVLAVSASIAMPRLRTLQADASAQPGASQTPLAMGVALGAGMLLAGLGERNVLLAVPLGATGIVGLVVALRRLLPPDRVRTPILLKGVLTFAFFGTDAYVSLSVTAVRHRSVTFAGVALTAATLTWTAGAWIQAHRGERIGAHRMIGTGFAVIAAGIVLMHLTLERAVPVGTVVLAWGVAGLGMGMAFQSVMVVVLAQAPAGQEGAASASQNLMDALGIAVGAGVVGAIVAVAAPHTKTALHAGFAVTLVVAIAGIALSARLAAPASDPAVPEPAAAPPPTQSSARTDPTPR